jgi:hypothetical protein
VIAAAEHQKTRRPGAAARKINQSSVDSCVVWIEIIDREQIALTRAVAVNMHPDNKSRTYFVVVSRRGDGALPFCWEIQRRPLAMGVKVSGSGYRSYRAAQDAGSKALAKFLDDFSEEAERSD